jgi:BlaI family transcriptional regulator, penicillinase repressor
MLKIWHTVRRHSHAKDSSMGKAEQQLSRRERQIMDVVYAKGTATAAEVHAALPDPPSNTAVRTLLRILETKGQLSHFEDGPRYVYRAVRSRDRVGRSSLRRVLETFFGGSLERAVAAHLTDSATDLSAEELKRLSQLINQARKKGK